MRTRPTISSHRAPTSLQAVIKNADMSEEMQQDAIDLAATAMDKYNVEKDIAACASNSGAPDAPPSCAPRASLRARPTAAAVATATPSSQSSRRSSTKSTAPRGTRSSGAALAAT